MSHSHCSLTGDMDITLYDTERGKLSVQHPICLYRNEYNTKTGISWRFINTKTGLSWRCIRRTTTRRLDYLDGVSEGPQHENWTIVAVYRTDHNMKTGISWRCIGRTTTRKLQYLDGVSEGLQHENWAFLTVYRKDHNTKTAISRWYIGRTTTRKLQYLGGISDGPQHENCNILAVYNQKTATGGKKEAPSDQPGYSSQRTQSRWNQISAFL